MKLYILHIPAHCPQSWQEFHPLDGGRLAGREFGLGGEVAEDGGGEGGHQGEHPVHQVRQPQSDQGLGDLGKNVEPTHVAILYRVTHQDGKNLPLT